MKPASPAEVLSLLHLRLQQASRLAAMLPEDALGVVKPWMVKDLIGDIETVVERAMKGGQSA